MMLDLILAVAGLAVTAAFVCRVDHTLWHREPVLQAINAAGGITALWVLTQAGQGMASAGEAVLLALAVLTLLLTYRHLPASQQEQQRAPQPVRSDEMRRVVGGKDTP